MYKLKILFLLSFFIVNINSQVYFNLLTTFYNDISEKRFLEYKQCIEENIKNESIKKIFIFYENFKSTIDGFLCHPKITIVPINERPTFKLYFDFANKNLKNELVIICNTDIFFDKSLRRLKKFDFNNKILALTRYNVPEYKGKWRRHEKSHDSWIFKSPFKDINADIKLGIPGCDNEVLRLFIENKIEVLNPSLNIKSWHLHLDDERHYYKEGYNGKYRIKIPFTKI